MPRSRAVWAMVVVPPVASRTASALNSGVYFRRAREGVVVSVMSGSGGVAVHHRPSVRLDDTAQT